MIRSRLLLAGALVAAAPFTVLAQATSNPSTMSSSTSDDAWERGRASSSSWIPYTSYGYVGLNLGSSDYRTPCSGLYACDNRSFAGKFYTGGMFSRIVGLELGYVNMGSADRNGGSQSAQGVNLSLVANLPLTDLFNVFGKVGGTYGWTRSRIGAGIAPGYGGNDNGLGLSYGGGLSFDLTREWQLVAEYDHHDFKFAAGREGVQMVSLGVKYKF